MIELHTNEALLKKLVRAASRRLSAEEIRRQRISFIMGSLDDKSTVTREQVSEVLNKQEGERTAA